MSSGASGRGRTPSSSAKVSCGPRTWRQRCGSSRSRTVAVTKVKICGITNAADARLSVDAGADALGFIFVEGTPRFIEPSAAAAIIAWLPPFVTPVGVFWDHAQGHVKAVAEQCRLGALQFHGQEPPEALADHRLPVIKTVKLPPASTIEGMPEYRTREQFETLQYHKVAAAVLLDTAVPWSEGEAREPIEWAH